MGIATRKNILDISPARVSSVAYSGQSFVLDDPPGLLKKPVAKNVTGFYFNHEILQFAIFGYNLKSLSEKSGYSLIKLRRIIKLFRSFVWCELHGMGLLFIAIDVREFKSH